MQTEFKTPIGRIGCHTVNLGEFFQSLDSQFGNEVDGKVKIPFEKWFTLMGLAWNKIQETYQECEGKEIVIEFGSTPFANVMEQLVKAALTFIPKEPAQ